MALLSLLDSWFNIPLTVGALVIEALVGYPDALFRAIRHPVVWVGALLSWLERRLNRAPHQRAAGALTVALLVAAVAIPAGALQWMLVPHAIGFMAIVVLASALPAQRSLYAHVLAVAEALDAGGLNAARRAVSHIVGRDPATLDAPAVARAAIESLAENFSDGVVAPAFWGAIAGLAGMAGYKAINTADSMVGHRTPRFEKFGWASARLDDGVNWPAARLAALFLLIAAALAGDARGAWRAVWRDARRHRSPNAGWPEAAMAGALGLRLAGPRVYAGVLVEDGWMGDGRAEAGAADVRRALMLYRLACAVELIALLLVLATI